MALDDAFMLPKRVRTMAQMADLLQAERLMLDRLYAVIQEMMAQSTINNNVTVTKELLEEVSTFFADNPCRVDEYSSELTIHIVVSRNGGHPTSIRRLIEGIDVLVPAHLKYIIVFELTVGVNICASKKAARIPYDLCGWGYAGELPERNVLGAIQAEDVQIGVTSHGTVFQSPLTGLYPTLNTVGAAHEKHIEIQVAGQGGIIRAPLAGDPAGGGVINGSVIPSIMTQVYFYEIDYCGADYCGEEGD